MRHTIARDGIIAGLLGAAWSVLTFLTVPIIVFEDVGPVNALKRSGSLLILEGGDVVRGIDETQLVGFLEAAYALDLDDEGHGRGMDPFAPEHPEGERDEDHQPHQPLLDRRPPHREQFRPRPGGHRADPVQVGQWTRWSSPLKAN